MAKALGAETQLASYDWDDPVLCLQGLEQLRPQIHTLKPKVITAVHCDTPCGSVNPIVPQLGQLAREVGAIFVLDAVSSVSGFPMLVDVRPPRYFGSIKTNLYLTH